MATYAVGDLQGCLNPLLRLLKQVNFNEANDRLWLTGDIINRGPESLETLRFVYEKRHCISMVLGNHDLHLLAVNGGHKKASPSDTLQEILTAPDKNTLLSWLQQQPLLHHDAQLGFTMVHAGIPPVWSLDQARKYANEVEQILQGTDHQYFFANMYGNQPNRWEEDIAGLERWRLITNYFTRMRFCTSDGQLELKTKTGPADAPKGYLPWFAHSKRSTRKDKIIFGHWAALEGEVHGNNVYALDTGYVWGKSMTMMRLEDEQRFSVGQESID